MTELIQSPLLSQLNNTTKITENKKQNSKIKIKRTRPKNYWSNLMNNRNQKLKSSSRIQEDQNMTSSDVSMLRKDKRVFSQNNLESSNYNLSKKSTKNNREINNKASVMNSKRSISNSKRVVINKSMHTKESKSINSNSRNVWQVIIKSNNQNLASLATDNKPIASTNNNSDREGNSLVFTVSDSVRIPKIKSKAKQNCSYMFDLKQRSAFSKYLNKTNIRTKIPNLDASMKVHKDSKKSKLPELPVSSFYKWI